MAVRSLHYGQDRLLLDKDHREHLICAGVRYGKSFAGPPWHFYRVVENAARGSHTSLIVAPDYKLAEQIALEYYKGFLDEMGFAEGRDYEINKAKLVINFPRLKHRVVVLSGEKPEKIIGYTSSHAWIDEAARCPEEVRNNVLMRNSCPHSAYTQTLYTTTPEGTNWLYSKFGPEQVRRIEGTPFSESDTKLVLHGRTRDNPWLKADYLKTLEEEFSWDVNYFLNYVEGEWVNLSRERFFFSFDSKMHVGQHKPDVATRQLIPTFDNNPGVMSLVVLQPRESGYAVVKSNGMRGQNVMHCCEQFVEMFPPHTWGNHRISIYGDASLWARSPVSHECGFDIIRSLLRPHYRNLEVLAPRGNSLVAERSVTVNRMFHRGRLLIDEACGDVLTSLKLTEGDGKGGIKKPRDDQHTHPMEAVSHCLVAIEPSLVKHTYSGIK